MIPRSEDRTYVWTQICIGSHRRHRDCSSGGVTEIVRFFFNFELDYFPLYPFG